MGAFMTAIPPLPPEIQAQQQQAAVPTFAQMGMRPQPGQQPGLPGAIPDPVQVLKAQVAKLEQWAADTAPLANQINPALTTLLVPIAQAGKALQAEIADLEQRTAGPSPQVVGSAPPNVPGNIPGGRPAM